MSGPYHTPLTLLPTLVPIWALQVTAVLVQQPLVLPPVHFGDRGRQFLLHLQAVHFRTVLSLRCPKLLQFHNQPGHLRLLAFGEVDQLAQLLVQGIVQFESVRQLGLQTVALGLQSFHVGLERSPFGVQDHKLFFFFSRHWCTVLWQHPSLPWFFRSTADSCRTSLKVFFFFTSVSSQAKFGKSWQKMAKVGKSLLKFFLNF